MLILSSLVPPRLSVSAPEYLESSRKDVRAGHHVANDQSDMFQRLAAASANFGYLLSLEPLLVRYAGGAELHVFTDPNVALYKMRQFAEVLVQRLAVEGGQQVNPRTDLATLIEGPLPRGSCCPATSTTCSSASAGRANQSPRPWQRPGLARALQVSMCAGHRRPAHLRRRRHRSQTHHLAVLRQDAIAEDQVWPA